jgi:hypothetical protein
LHFTEVLLGLWRAAFCKMGYRCSNESLNPLRWVQGCLCICSHEACDISATLWKFYLTNARTGNEVGCGSDKLWLAPD